MQHETESEAQTLIDANRCLQDLEREYGAVAALLEMELAAYAAQRAKTPERSG